MQYLVSAVLKTLADVTDAQHTSIPAQAMLRYWKNKKWITVFFQSTSHNPYEIMQVNMSALRY